MDEQTEFTRYRLLREELRERVARLGERHREVMALEAQMEALRQDMPELAELPGPGEVDIAWEGRECERCGQRFVSHFDERWCPECEEG